MMNGQRDVRVQRIVQIALMGALVFVGTTLRIKIPAGTDGVMLHFGNVFGLLGGMLFGALPGGLAAGIGSALFDLTSEYASEAWITFINKFAMGFVAGLITHWNAKKAQTPAVLRVRTIVGGIFGSITYCVLYLAKNIVVLRFVNGLVWEGVWPVITVKGAVTLTNGLIAVAASLILVFSLRPALERAKLLQPRLVAKTPPSVS